MAQALESTLSMDLGLTGDQSNAVALAGGCFILFSAAENCRDRR
jgi:hypothetical protein